MAPRSLAWTACRRSDAVFPGLPGGTAPRNSRRKAGTGFSFPRRWERKRVMGRNAGGNGWFRRTKHGSVPWRTRQKGGENPGKQRRSPANDVVWRSKHKEALHCCGIKTAERRKTNDNARDKPPGCRRQRRQRSGPVGRCGNGILCVRSALTGGSGQAAEPFRRGRTPPADVSGGAATQIFQEGEAK